MTRRSSQPRAPPSRPRARRIFFVVSLLKQAIAQVEGRERVVKRYARRRPSKALAGMCR